MRKAIGILLGILLVCCLAAGSLAAAEKATTHTFTLSKNATVAGTRLKAGEYKVQITDNEVVFLQGKKEVARSAAKIENAKQKHDRDSIRLDGDSVSEIRPGGTTTIIVLSGSKPDKSGM